MRSARHADVSAVCLHQLSDDGQARPTASRPPAAGLFGPPEAVEHPGQVLVADAAARVLHLDGDGACHAAGAEGDAAVPAAVAVGVVIRWCSGPEGPPRSSASFLGRGGDSGEA